MPKQKPKLARRARIACEKWREGFKHNIDQYHIMHSFVLGEQWTQDEEDDMVKTFRKVPLSANKLGTMANSLLGEQQQNTPQLQVVPMANCDEEVAHLRELITKDIMFSNSTSTVYQVAAGQAAIGGYSAFLVDTDYAHAKSFDLDIVYRHFKDATRTYFDIGAEHINKIDGMHCGFLSRMTREKFRQVYGKDIEQNILKSGSITATKEEIALAVQPSEGDDPFNWADDEAITIIDHYERKHEKEMLYKMSNGSVLNQEELDELIEKSRDINRQNYEAQLMMAGEIPGQNLPYGLSEEPLMSIEEETERMPLWDGDQIVRIEESRPYKHHKIMHYKIAGDYVLEESEFPSESLPLIFVDNNSYYEKTGKQMCRSFFGDAKDTQRYINYLRTQSAYILKVSRYDQWIGPKTVVSSADTRRNWADPNNIQGLLAFDKDPDGMKPEQIRPPELSASLFQQYELAIQDLYTSTGLYPARMGNNGDEASGVAIDARTRQGSYTTYVFFNSINRAIAAAGQVVNEMIPRVYDSERVIALMTPDEGMKNVIINRESDAYGERIENDIRKGTYEVRLKPGPSYEGQKEQALHSLREVLQADPTAFNLIADLYADNLPLSNTIEIKNRLKTRVPPQIIEAGKTGKMPQQQGPTPEQEALSMEASFKTKELELKAQELELKKQEILMEAQFKIQELETERLKTAGELQEQELRYAAESERTISNQQISHADNLVKILTHKINANKEMERR